MSGPSDIRYQPKARARAVAHRPHVLVISHDVGLVEFLTEGLVIGGFWVSSVSGGILTLEVFRLRSFDLVLMDTDLPGLATTDLLGRLRATAGEDAGRRTIDLPILMVAGSAGAHDADFWRRAGADGSLVPPLDLDDLVPRLHTVVEEWRVRHPDRPWADEVAQATTIPEQRPSA
jgi:DNA-binding response OmpR family regulator